MHPAVEDPFNVLATILGETKIALGVILRFPPPHGEVMFIFYLLS